LLLLLLLLLGILQALSLLHGSQLRGRCFTNIPILFGTNFDVELVLFARPGWSFRCQR
jgi:hypothetical protein